MDADRWRRVEELYHAARSMPDNARAQFLAQQCGGDESLRSEVQSLLTQPEQTWAPAASAAAAAPPKSLSAGDRIGAYQVVSLIGAGGMGEVYRAHDAKLSRDVAIKILPREWIADSDRIARLGREARVLASLNHPNIATIHGVEDTGGMPALVLELVEGETLADRIAAGPIALPGALALARQIADALDAAHEKGIVHRDLKPANIKITPAGVVKVLDFGLAKLNVATDSALSQSPTLTLGGTREGVIAGTAAYMSPEQARGLAVDKRTDIWAFGCVLYEMLVGRPAFSGDTISDVIAAILHREPDFDALSGQTPVGIRQLMQRCVAKDQRLRWRDIGDVRLELDIAARPPGPATTAPTRRSAMVLPWAVAAAAMAIALVGFVRPFGAVPAPSSAPRLSQAIRLTQTPAQEFGPAIAPDGKWVTYYANNGRRTDVWVKYLDSGAALNLTSSFNLELPVRTGVGGLGISPDGRQIAFAARPDPTTAQFDTWTMPGPLGGTPRRLLPGATSIQWSPDGQQLVYTIPGSNRGDTLAIASKEGTDQRVLIEHEGGRHIHWSDWSYDGRWVYFINTYDTWQAEPAEIHRIAASGGTPESIVRTARRALFPLSLPGGLLFSANPNSLDLGLWWLPDGGGQPAALTNGLGEHGESRVSADRTKIVSSLVDMRQSLVAMSVDSASAERRQLTNGFDGDVDPSIDRASGRVVFSSARSGDRNLWIAAPDGSGAIPLTTESAMDTRPVFSPDGKEIAFLSDRGSTRGIWLISSQGGAPRLLARENVLDTLTWSRDGTRILFARPGADLPALATVTVDDGRVEPFPTPGGAFSPTWSPTDDVIAYLEPVTIALPPPSTATVARMYVRFVDPGGRRMYPEVPDTTNFANGQIVWSLDGRRLAAVSVGAGTVAQFWTIEPGSKQPFRKITDLPASMRPHGFAWATDGKTVIYGNQEAASDIVLYEVKR